MANKPVFFDNGTLTKVNTGVTSVGTGIDTTTATTLTVGSSTATEVVIGKSAIAVGLTGDVTVNGVRVAEAPGYVWEQQRILGDANWVDVTYTGTRFVAVSNGGGSTIATSDDGVSWDSQVADGANYYGIAASGSTVIATGKSSVGNTTAYIRSTNGGLTWSSRTTLPGFSIRNWKIRAGASNNFLVFAEGARYSTDGGVSYTGSSGTPGQWTDAVYGNSKWFLIGPSGYRVSTNLGATFSGGNLPRNGNWYVAYGNGAIVAVTNQIVTNQVVVSTDDGATWTEYTSAEQNSWTGVSFDSANNAFVAVASNGTNRVMRSTDNGQTWTAYAAAGTDAYTCVTYGASDGLFAALSAVGDDNSKVMTSTDGTSWTERSVSESTDWREIGYGGGQFVALSNSGTAEIAYTSEGISWESATSPVDTSWRGITYGNGVWVGVGYDSTNGAVAISSPNASDWTDISTNISGLIDVRDIAFGENRFVMCSYQGTAFAYSDDAASWTPVSANQYTARAITYGKGAFYTAGKDFGRYIARSPDGITWSAAYTGTVPHTMNSIAYGNGVFVLVGNGGTVMRSENGDVWTQETAAAANNWQKVIFGGGIFVAVSSDGTDRVMTSRDGITWSLRTPLVNNAWYSVAYGNGMYIAVAGDGANRAATSGTPFDTVPPTQNTYLAGLNVYQGLNVESGTLNLINTSINVGSTSVTSGSAVYISGSSAVSAADASSTSTANVMGFYDGTSGTIINSGLLTPNFEAGYSPTAGDVVYLSDSTAGSVTGTAPTAAGSVVAPVGVMLTATSMLIRILTPVYIAP